MTSGLAAVGAFYGLETSSSTLGAVITTTLYGFLGTAIGAPLAFAINVTRHWRQSFFFHGGGAADFVTKWLR
jgi:hypothetical protein